jgi:hypothetical protein
MKMSDILRHMADQMDHEEGDEDNAHGVPMEHDKYKI